MQHETIRIPDHQEMNPRSDETIALLIERSAMNATTLEFPTGTDDFTARPDDTLKARYRHLDLRRRVRLETNLCLVFEDRHTLWFRMRELNRVARTADQQVRPQLNWYEQLLPTPGRVTAAITVTPRGCPTKATQLRHAVSTGRLVLRSDAQHEVIGQFLPHTQSDPLVGLVRWAEFRFPDVAVLALHHPNIGWTLSLEAEGLDLPAVAVRETVLESLSADLS
jgi:hypothetical protein